MNYLFKLNDDEVSSLFTMVSGEGFKVLFQKQPKEFNKIKPGFRPASISEQDALALALKFRNKPFIDSYVNRLIESWLTEIDNHTRENQINTEEPEAAIAAALATSVFAHDVELYFKIAGLPVDEKYIEKVNSIVSAVPTSNESEEVVGVPDDTREMLQRIAELSARIEAYEQEKQTEEHKHSEAIQAAQAEIDQLRTELSTTLQQLQHSQQQVRAAEEELHDLRIRAEYDDAQEESVYDTGYDYVSLCEVTPPDYNGRKWLNRLADINKNGTMEVFIRNEEISPYFGNRDKLFFVDGPNEEGTIAVWNWTAQPRDTDPSKDRIISHFNQELIPVEVVTIVNCSGTSELLNALKNGIDCESTSSRILFAGYLSKGQYIGFLCTKQDIEQIGAKEKLRSDVISLPLYNFHAQDVLRLPNKKTFFRRLSLGIPADVINVKNPLELVQSVLNARSTWQVFKQLGKTRNEWRFVKDFFEQIDTDSVIEEIMDVAKCSHAEATRLLDDYFIHAGTYIDGTSVEDRVIEAVLAGNEALMARCKALIADDWAAENRVTIDAANDAIQNLQVQFRTQEAEIEQALNEKRDAAADEIALAKKQLLEIHAEYDSISAESLKLSEDIRNQQKLAQDVESAVQQRIQDAQRNAADFIAGLSFLPPMYPAQDRANPVQISAAEGGQFRFIEGSGLPPENLENVTSWGDVLDLLTEELITAGITSAYAKSFAAYLYSAYLNRVPVLLMGPNTASIADAAACALSGRTAAVLDCAGKYSPGILDTIKSGEDHIIRITNPFAPEWVNHIPELVSCSDFFFIVTCPYSEDIQIEPKSLFSYMLPVLTELLVEKAPEGEHLGSRTTGKFVKFTLGKAANKSSKIYSTLRISPLVKNRIQTLLANLHTMLKNQTTDEDFLFALVPYAFATMQMPKVIDYIQSNSDKADQLSSNTANLITAMYGDNE